jgi:hypothetical protein
MLSKNPVSYSRGVVIDLYDPATRQLLIRDPITNLQVLSGQAIPEPNFSMVMLVISLGGAAGSLLKRKLNVNKI